MPAAFEPVPPEVESVVTQVVDAALRVHREVGPGLLESVYEACLCQELSKRGLKFQRQQGWPIVYDGVKLESGLRIDLIVEDAIIVELKSVERLIPLFESQLLSYLKLTGKRIGLLINFNVPLLKDGIKRLIH